MKQKVTTKYYENILLVYLIMILTLFVGCDSSNERRSTDIEQGETLETMEEPLRIFYDGTGYYLLKSFVDAHPEMNIMLINCIPNVDGAIDFDSIVAQYGVPDLIVAREEVSIFLSEWYEEGHIADLSEFCSSDISINPEDYFPETFDVFSENGNMYALPLGITMDFMLTSESKYENSSFAKLDDGYTGRELMNILLAEVQKEKESGEFFSDSSLSVLLYMHYLDAVTQTEDGIQMDEELFKLVYDYEYKRGKIANDAENFWIQQGKDFGSLPGYIPIGALEPRRYEGKFTASMWSFGDAPALVLSYVETAYQYFLEEGVKAIYFPTADDGSQYQARVKLWGAVAGESSRKELAYELLRQLLDEDIDSFGGLWGMSTVQGAGILNVNLYPVNIENAISLLDRFESYSVKLSYGESAGEPIAVLDRTGVSKFEKEKHENMLKSISGLFCWNKDLRKIASIYDDYYNASIADYENCYIEMLNELNSNKPAGNTFDFNEDSHENVENSEIIDAENELSEEIKKLKEEIKDIKVGETFFFGETEQDNNVGNGAEPIEWIVLEKTEDKAFVISKKVLEWLTFSKYDMGNYRDYFSWDIELNQQRFWLTNELYQNGFSNIEKELILSTYIEDCGLYADDYNDYLYIPSEEEVEEYMQNKDLRIAEMTAYVAEKANQIEGKLGCWSLRSMPMPDSFKYTMHINEDGELSAMYTFTPNGVRPVMWLDIS